ncbi:hypothetical protein AQUCO_01000536v1 [Aquilegia coerulea]|uniref:Uncharacterized protein n=1 Tax=Aquilegia coerulea TaxID=218851 RepID=A0A2G5EAI3_AQUCA|nr:hypothetical protein AQUCO_01000536v1 [Aquilegia coerulea]PIA52731.1 hypothetical protein AQUCO_01000536v1 [Aquilegia coerulea]
MSELSLQGDHDKNYKAQKRSRHSAWMFNETQTSWDSAPVLHRSFSINGDKDENQASVQGPIPVQKVESKQCTPLDVDVCAGTSLDTKRIQQGKFHVKSDVAKLVKTNSIDATKFGAAITKEALKNLRNFISDRPDQHSFSISVNQRVGDILAPRKHLAVCNKHISSSPIDGDTTAGTSKPDFPSRLLRLGLSDPKFPPKDTSNQTISLSQNRAYWPSEYSMPISEVNNPNSSRVDTKFTFSEHEHCNHVNFFTYLLCDKKKDKQLFAQNSEGINQNSYSRQKTKALWLNDPPTNKLCFPASEGNITHEYSCTRLSPCHCSPLGLTDSEGLNCRDRHLHRMPICPVHDIDTSTTCGTVGMIGILGGAQLLSQTSDAKKTGANFTKETHVIREPIRFTNSKGSPLHELLILPSTSDFQDSWVPKLQDSRNPTRRKRNNNIRNGVTSSIMDESPAETDTINITEFSGRKPYTGVASCPSSKDLRFYQSPVKSQATGEEIDEIRRRKTDSNISDRKQETLRLLAPEDSIQNRARSTSVTETLDVENIYSSVEQPEKYEFNFQQNLPFDQQNMRWAKRLKLEMGDFPSGDRVNELCKRIKNSDSSSSHLILNKFPDEGQMEMSRGPALLNNRGSISPDYLYLSHPWIQRWCPKGQQMKPTTPVTHKPENLKAVVDEFHTKKFPSIAAMALVGKATSSFQPCRTRKRGSVMIWNIEGIR